jgi:hypothetical protein
MILFPNFKDTLLKISEELDNSPKLLPCPLLVGIDFSGLAASGGLDDFLNTVGFQPKSPDLWQRGEEIYENHFEPSRNGYISLGEINDWRIALLQRIHELAVRLHLPLGESLIEIDLTTMRIAIDGYMNSSVRARLVYHPLSQPKEQAALFVALEIFEWAFAWQILFEDMFFRNALTPSFITSALHTISAEFDHAEIARMLHIMRSRPETEGLYDSSSSKNESLTQLEDLLKKYK